MEEKVRGYLKEKSALKGSTLVSIEELAGDASTRQYYKVNVSGGKIESAILCQFPEGTKTNPRPAKQFSDLARFFRDYGIFTPDIYFHHEKDRVLLLEDVGTNPLFAFAENKLKDDGEKIKDLLGQDWREQLFSRALTVIQSFQSIPRDPKHPIFSKTLSFERYRTEIEEFSEFYAEPAGLKPSEKVVLATAFDAICETLCSVPTALSHFDFTSHNLFVSPKAEIRVLDFQDACMVSYTRDLVSLINDRGIDELLGKKLHSTLYSNYLSLMKPGPQFNFHYNVTLLHWDFRVSGRFLKLCKTKNTERYKAWVPGTLRRLGRTLFRSYRDIHTLDDVLEIALRLSPEVKEGTQDPWNFPT